MCRGGAARGCRQVVGVGFTRRDSRRDREPETYRKLPIPWTLLPGMFANRGAFFSVCVCQKAGTRVVWLAGDDNRGGWFGHGAHEIVNGAGRVMPGSTERS